MGGMLCSEDAAYPPASRGSQNWSVRSDLLSKMIGTDGRLIHVVVEELGEGAAVSVMIVVRASKLIIHRVSKLLQSGGLMLEVSM